MRRLADLAAVLPHLDSTALPRQANMADHHLSKASTEPLHSRAVTAEDILLREDPAAPAREASHRSKVTEVPRSRVAIRHRDTRGRCPLVT